jgi:asparagine synthase (glutamine-hydrolysing)
MSAIAGVFRFDGREVSRRDLERACNALHAHGPDRTGVSVLGEVGLVHVLMRMTPECRFDRQPWRGASGATITADLRLDNREEVLTSIGIVGADAASWSDSRVVLTAWEKRGDELWASLRGPFAVAIWDPSRRVLVLARDHLGLNVLFWHRTKDLFAFATMPKGLFALPDVRRELNDEKFADFLVLNHTGLETTIYKNIVRLAPAHVATVRSDGEITQRLFWSTHDITPVRLRSNQEYADALRTHLDRAVRRQMRSLSPVGCYLSGGLDSSSIAALAARALSESGQRLSTYTQVPRPGFDGQAPLGRYVDETPFVEEIRERLGNLDLNYVRNDECDDFDELERFFVAFEGPVRNPTNLGWMLAILRLARQQGRRVLLGGLFGNYTISWTGWSQSIDHLARGRVGLAYQQWRQCYRLSPYSRLATLFTLFLNPVLPSWVTRSVYRLQNPSSPGPWHEHSAIRADFAVAMNVEGRAAKTGHDFLYGWRAGERLRSMPPVDYLGEWFAAEKAYAGVEVRDPTADIDVLSFCFGVPPEQFLAEDVDRSLIRRAMWGLLPESVLTNRKFGLQSADWYEKLSKRRHTVALEIDALSRSPLARQMLDLDRLKSLVRQWPEQGWHTRRVSRHYELALPRAIAAGRFLRWLDPRNDDSV